MEDIDKNGDGVIDLQEYIGKKSWHEPFSSSLVPVFQRLAAEGEGRVHTTLHVTSEVIVACEADITFHSSVSWHRCFLWSQKVTEQGESVR